MNLELPDKYIRKNIFDRLNNVLVDGKNIPVFDFLSNEAERTDAFIIIASQNSNVDYSNKCTKFYDSETIIEVNTRIYRTANAGSRLLADNIMDAVRSELNDAFINLSPSSLKVVTQQISFNNDLVTNGTSFIYYRKFLRLTLKIC